LYSTVTKIKCFLAGVRRNTDEIREFLKNSGVKFEVVEPIGVDDITFERFTLTKIPNHIKAEDRFLYLHTKGVSSKHSTSDNVYWWRNWMEYHLIYRHKECLEQLERVNIVGVGYTTKQIGPHFSGNFWWTKGSYYMTLPKNPDGSLNIGHNYTDPENYIFKGSSPTHSDMDTGRTPSPDTDFYSAKQYLVRIANNPPKLSRGGRRRTR
jgi:hypothetical protein